MSISIKTALFFILATFATCAFENEIIAINKKRHSLLAPLNDLNLSTEEAKREISNHINQCLMVPESQSNEDFWFQLLGKQIKYEVRLEQEGLNEDELKIRLKDFIDKSFPKLDTVNLIEGAEEKKKNYFANLAKIYDELARLMKLEMVNQFLKVSSVEETVQPTITFYDVIIKDVQNQLFEKINAFIDQINLTVNEEAEQVKQSLNLISVNLKVAFFDPLVKLLDLYLNSIIYYSYEAKYAIIQTQIDQKVNSDIIVEKIRDIFISMGELSARLKDETHLMNLYGDFEPFIAASKRGSTIGSVAFKLMIPDIVGSFLTAVSIGSSNKKSFQLAKKYFMSIVTIYKSLEMEAFLVYNSQKNLLPIIDDSSDENFVKNALKTIDIINHVEYHNGLDGWWSLVLTNFAKIQISAEMIVNNEMSKRMMFQVAIPFYKDEKVVNKAYYDGLYDLLVQFVALNDTPIQEEYLTINFGEFVDALFVQTDEQINQEDSDAVAQHSFIKKYYLWIKLEAIGYRMADDVEVSFADFITGNEVNYVAGKTLMADYINTLIPNAVGRWYLKEVKKSKGFTKTEVNDRIYLSYLSGKKMSISVFQKYNIGETKRELKTDLKNGELTQKKTFVPNVINGKANDRLQALKKSKIIIINKEEEPTTQKIITQIQEPLNEQIRPLNKLDKIILKLEPISESNEIEEEEIENEKIVDLKPVDVNPSPIKENFEIIDQKNEIEDVSLEKEADQTIIHSLPIGETPKKISEKIVEIEEEDISIGNVIEEDKSPIQKIQVDEDLKNIVEVMKGELSEAELKYLIDAEQLVDSVSRIEIVVDPITGDETHYHYIQVVPKDSECYDAIYD